MSTGQAILDKLRSFFVSDIKPIENRKRRAEVISSPTFPKYRRVSDHFPKIISAPLEDEAIYNNPYLNTFHISPKLRFPMDNYGKNTQQFKKPSVQYVVDDELSDDDEENDVVYVPPSRRTLPNMNSIKLKGCSNVPSFKTKMKPIPPLISTTTTKMNPNNYSRGNLMLSQVPGLTPIDKTKFFSWDSFRPREQIKNRSIFNGTGNKIGGCFSSKKRQNSSIIQASFNMQNKKTYANLLAQICPSLNNLKTPVTERKSPPRVVETVDLTDEKSKAYTLKRTSAFDDSEFTAQSFGILPGLQTSQLNQSADNSQSNTRRSSSSIDVIDIQDVTPVNSLRNSFVKNAPFADGWLTDVTHKFLGKYAVNKNAIVEEEESLRDLAITGKKQHKDLTKKFQDCYIDKTSVIEIEDDEEDEDDVVDFTKEQHNIIKNSIRGGSPDEVIVSKFSMNITRRDLHTLTGDKWLNDEVINFYMNLLMDRSQLKKENGYPAVHSMNTFFIPRLLQGGHSAVRRWTRKIDIFSYDIIPVPVHVGNVHWCMAIINLKSKYIKYYDSMGQSNKNVLDALQMYLKEESLDKKKVEFDMTGWLIESVRDSPKQMNGSDCGVFSCITAEYFSRQANVTFSQEHMPHFRERMILEIATGKLIH